MNCTKISLALALVWGTSLTLAQSVEIGTWAGFRKGAVSFTFDDGPKSDAEIAAPMFEKYGYRATFNIVTNWVGANGMVSWNDVKTMASAGHEIASHSESHPGNGAMPSNEISSSKRVISNNVQQSYGCITLAYPNCVTPGDQQVLQNYIAGRICNGSWSGGSDIMSQNGPSNWAAVPAIMTGNQGSENFTGSMQSAVNSGGWVMFLTHGFTTGTNGYATYSPTSATAMENALGWAKQNDKDIWVAPFRNVAMYLKERKAAEINPMDGGNSNIFAFELKHSIADNISKYDYPLSLRMEKPEGWETIQVMQGNAELETSIVDGYIYFDAVPNAGQISVMNVNASNSSSSVEESSSSEASSSSQTTALSEIPNNFPFAVYADNGSISVSGAQGMSVTVFNALGNKLRSTKVLGCEQKVFTGAKGLYIVKVGSHSFKVRL